jgi:hypothetical protein
MLGSSFKFFIDHYVLNYLVNRSFFCGRIWKWLFFFQKFYFEVVVKLGKYNVALDHMSEIETSEVVKNLNDELPSGKIFHDEVVPNQLIEIAEFIITS